MGDYKIKYLPSFHQSKHVAIAVRVYPDGRREAVLSDSYPSVSQTEKLFDDEQSAIQAARNRWSNKSSSARK